MDMHKAAAVLTQDGFYAQATSSPPHIFGSLTYEKFPDQTNVIEDMFNIFQHASYWCLTFWKPGQYHTGLAYQVELAPLVDILLYYRQLVRQLGQTPLDQTQDGSLMHAIFVLRRAGIFVTLDHQQIFTAKNGFPKFPHEEVFEVLVEMDLKRSDEPAVRFWFDDGGWIIEDGNQSTILNSLGDVTDYLIATYR
jgi:hypothetical protein